MSENDNRHPSKDLLYNKIKQELLPSSESLKDTVKRVTPIIKMCSFLKSKIIKR